MAGMNRLGAGPKKPGIIRPIDPNRYRSIELQPEGVEGDLEYQKLVQEVEDGVGSRQAGWLAGRGAFDKTDLQYLKDQDEKNKYVELERKELESSAFAKLRAQQEQAADESDTAAGAAVLKAAEQARLAKKQQATTSKQTQLLARMVKVKRTNSKGKEQPAKGGDPPEAKRAKVEAATDNKGNSGGNGGLSGLLGDYGSDSDEATSD